MTYSNNTGLISGNVYFYRVRAVGAQNNSVPSNEASAMTLASGACNVTSTSDNGNGAVGSGTLSAAIKANCGAISFSLTSGQTIMVTGKLPALPINTLIGGRCSVSGPGIIIRAGVGLPATITGLTLSGNNKLYGLSIEKFPGQAVMTQGTGNKFWCTKASK